MSAASGAGMPELAMPGQGAETGEAQGSRWRGRPWPWALAAVIFLTYLMWAGSGRDPRAGALFVIGHSGWFAPAPGLGHLLIASALLFAALSMVAYRAFECRGMGDLARAIVPWIVVVVALQMRALVLRAWAPLQLEPGLPVVWQTRWPLLIADMATVGLVVLSQMRHQGTKNLWLAAIYAFHPLPLAALAAGSKVLWALPAILLVAMLGWSLRKWVRLALMAGASAACMLWLWHDVHLNAGTPFDGLLAEVFIALGIAKGPLLAGALMAIGLLLQGGVLALAILLRWDLARVWGHILLAWAIVSPQVTPAEVLPILALLPLAWTRSGWVLSLTCLLTYGIALSWQPGNPWELPLWVTFLIMMPVVVLEGEELLLQLRGLRWKARPVPVTRGLPVHD